MKKYGVEWTRCYEEWWKFPYVWKVIDLPDGEELWEENQLGRLFLVKGDEVWEYEF